MHTMLITAIPLSVSYVLTYGEVSSACFSNVSVNGKRGFSLIFVPCIHSLLLNSGK